jgi:hypothetical protein
VVSQAFLIQLLVCLGLKDKPSKRIPPARSVPFIGFIVDFLSHSVHNSRHGLPLSTLRSSTPPWRRRGSPLCPSALWPAGYRLSPRLSWEVALSPIGSLTLVPHRGTSTPFPELHVPTLIGGSSTSPLLMAGCHGAHWAVFHPWAYLATNALSLGAAGVCSFPRAWVHAWRNRSDTLISKSYKQFPVAWNCGLFGGATTMLLLPPIMLRWSRSFSCGLTPFIGSAGARLGGCPP